jgi:hypothetical protein
MKDYGFIISINGQPYESVKSENLKMHLEEKK